MAKFDHSKPFSTVHGNHPAKYYQAGVLYSADYEPWDADPEPDEHADNVLLDAEEPVVEEPVVEEELVEEKPVTILAEVDYESMPWQTVKKYVESAGGTWTNKLKGIKFLRGE